MFIRPEEVVPDFVNFDAIQGYQDLITLDSNTNITDSSVTHYMGNAEVSKYMCRLWGGRY